MRSSTETLLSLFEWGRLMGIDPWELAQVGRGFPESRTNQCPSVWFQYQWQQNFLSREEIAFAIREAEEIVAREIGYWPAPKYIEETVLVPQPAQLNLYGTGMTIRGQWSGVRLSFSKIIGGGFLSRSVIETGAAVTYSDTDGDGVLDTFTVTATVPDSITDPDEIGVYYTSADRVGDLDETNRIRPVKVSISGVTATITGHRSLVVKALTKYESLSAENLDVTDANNFVTELDVYRVFRDSTSPMSQGWGLWTSLPENYIPTDPTQLGSEPIALGEVNSELGYVAIAPITTECSLNRAPDMARVRYLAGVPRRNGMMDQEFADIVAHLATALLPEGACGCARSSQIIDYWRSFPTTEEAGRTRPILFDEILSAAGEKRGGIYAWKKILRLRQLTGARV